MKVGILTFNWAINYGAILQMLAEYSFLKKYSNDDIYIINYLPDSLKNLYKLKLISNPLHPKNFYINFLNIIIKKNVRNKFKEFISRNFHTTKEIKNLPELSNELSAFDVVVVGSDQVWNYNIVKRHIRAYLVDFKEINIKKVAYAASLGNSEVHRDVLDVFKRTIPSFKAVSVREEKLIDTLNNIYQREDYRSVLDPVFLLSKEEWKEIAKTSNYNLKDNNYILLFMLEYNIELIDSAIELSKNRNLPIYIIETPFYRRHKFKYKINRLHDVGPSDFIKLFLEADYILTNSFHATAFSLIFEKSFLPFAHSTYNLRIENLLNLFNLKDIIVYRGDSNNIDFNNLDNISTRIFENKKDVLSIIDTSKKYLLNSING